jgi:hypothetical protein
MVQRVGEHGLNGRELTLSPPRCWASRLYTTAYRSQTAHYNQLLRIDPFFGAARYSPIWTASASRRWPM